MNRKCMHADESFAERKGDGKVWYHIAIITENEPGYHKGYSHPDLATLQLLAKSSNESNGISEDDVLNIRLSSMAVSR